MKKKKLYLETSVWNFFFADDSPEKRDITKVFLTSIGENLYLANLRKAELFNAANLERGYTKHLEIVTPMEVGKYEG